MGMLYRLGIRRCRGQGCAASTTRCTGRSAAMVTLVSRVVLADTILVAPVVLGGIDSDFLNLLILAD